MGGKEVLIEKGDIPDNTKPVGHNAKLIGVAEMPIDIHLLNGVIGSGMGRHGVISGFIRGIGIIQHLAFLKVFNCLMIRFTYLGLFSVTQASISDVSNKAIEAFAVSMRWHIGSVRSTRPANMDCKSKRRLIQRHHLLLWKKIRHMKYQKKQGKK